MAQLFPNEDKYNHIILKVSQETGVPYSVIKGFIATESGFNPKAYRYEPHIKDASYGLMQILSKTANSLGYSGQPYELFEPETNIRYGTLFIKKLHKKYPKIQDLIASYNAGFPRTAKNTTPLLIKLYGKPEPEWNYANQPYVDKVSSYIAYYQAKEKHDEVMANTLLDFIKKKNLNLLKSLSQSLIGELKWT